MKLRFRNNSLRLRVNRREVDMLAAGRALREQISFPNARFSYVLEPFRAAAADASFREGEILVKAPLAQVQDWASGESIGLYFNLSAGGSSLNIAIEKDLECLDGLPEERDLEAFPRQSGNNCS